ncbi:hypothetical protein MtrunA17_Chr6g0465331 [Medicago truncatula]|uniref:Galactose oxidase, putative n=1 Tax=Medicago truncatula TaxID=3880 RepID=G7KHP8_MEDTR|nr:galactose oxidase, putative [Medicago truncatula]RHN51155.1 hypothetical protein MtrunA17_Chr6g0465331 [Medicago truncatula]
MMINNQRRKTWLEAKETLHVPHELTIEFHPSLLVKSLLGFKCVCKFWLSLIFDLHMQIIHILISVPQYTHVDFEPSIDDDIANENTNPSFIHPQSDCLIEIISSCRCFVFLHRNSIFYQ